MLRQAWVDGAISGGQVRAVVANLDEVVAPLFAEHEADLVPNLVGLSVEDTTTVAREWRARADAIVDRPPPPERPCTATQADLLDGRSRLVADLGPEGSELARQALKLFESRDGAGELRTPAERRGDALVDIFRFACEYRPGSRSPRRRAHMTVVIDWDDLLAGGGGHTEAGRPVDPTTAASVACDAVIHRLLTTGPSAILDYGRGSYVVPADLWHALVARDGGCRWPGCDRGPEWCDAHHVLPWEQGGPTALENLVLACTRHHHLGHRVGPSSSSPTPPSRSPHRPAGTGPPDHADPPNAGSPTSTDTAPAVSPSPSPTRCSIASPKLKPRARHHAAVRSPGITSL